MRNYLITVLTVGMLGAFAYSPQLAAGPVADLFSIFEGKNYGRKSVICRFLWEENREKNISGQCGYKKAANQRPLVGEKARKREIERLVEAGNKPVKISRERNDTCDLNHPENRLMDIRITKSLLRITSSGRIPDCQDLNARVECERYHSNHRWSKFCD